MSGKSEEKGFLDFSKFLIQQDEYMDYGKKVTQKVFEALKESSYGLDRVSSAGLFGKDLAGIVFIEHDVIIFVKDDDPQFDDILDDFEQILKDFAESTSSENEPIQVDRRQNSISINYNGYKINLIPGVNVVNYDANKKPTIPIFIAQQAHGILQKIEKDSSRASQFSGSLCDTHFDFMSKQTAFVLSLVRLCKFWNKSLLIPSDDPSGRSTLIELIAVSIGQKEEKSSKKVQQVELILTAFTKFLEQIVNFHDLNLEFKDFDPLKTLRTKGVSWKPSPSSFDPNLRSPPFVLEPSNPYNNLAKIISEPNIQLFKSFATETLQRLAQRNPKDVSMDSIFKPQPTILPFKGNKTLEDFLKKADFIFDVEADGPPSKNEDDDEMESEEESEDEFDEGDDGSEEEFPFTPVMEIHKMSKRYTLADTKEILGYVQTILSVVGQSFAYSYSARHKSPLDTEKVRKNLKMRIENCVSVNIKGSGQAEDVQDDDGDGSESDDEDVDHDEYEVSFDMPVKVPGVKLNVAVSFREA